jgi:hypothetical protein
MSSNLAALEFAEATEQYARLSKELEIARKSGPSTEYEAKFLEFDAPRKRCEKARHALKALRVKRRASGSG